MQCMRYDACDADMVCKCMISLWKCMLKWS